MSTTLEVSPPVVKCPVCESRGSETFRYMDERYIFNVDKARALVQDGREPVEMEPEDVQFSLRKVHITKEHVPHVDVKFPGIIAHVWHTNPNGETVRGHRLIDGHHRAARSIELGLPFFAHLLTEEESRSILKRSPDSPKRVPRKSFAIPRTQLSIAKRARKKKTYIKHTLETPRRFSESMFWPLMADYHTRQGIAARSNGQVPFRISSNTFIAHAYAQVIRGYLRDTAKGANRPLGARRVVTILELGAGSGQLGFLLTRALLDLVASHDPDTLPRFRYVMTDAAESNVLAWMAHPRLKPLVEAGLMDFAVLNVSAPADARLSISGESLAEAIGGDPVVVVANYLLDGLDHDAFRVEHGVLQEVRIGLDLDQEASEIVGSSKLFNTMHFCQEFAPVKWPYYPEPALDGILEEYSRTLKSATFLFPVAALRSLETIRRFADGRLLLLVGDKARIAATQLEGHNSLSMKAAGSFSTKVNLDAVARWTRKSGGNVNHRQPASELFDTYSFLLGQAAPCIETERAFAEHICRFGPFPYWALTADVKRRTARFKPRANLALLELGGYDPFVLLDMEEVMIEAVGTAKVEERQAFVVALEKVWANYYPIGGPDDLAFILGRLFRRLGLPGRALEFYRASIEEHGAHYATLRNMGNCYEDLGDRENALACYRKVLGLQFDITAEEAIARLAGLTDPTIA